MQRSSSALLERRPSFKNLFIESDRAGNDPCLLTVIIDPEKPVVQCTRPSDVQIDSFVEFMQVQQKRTRIDSQKNPFSWQRKEKGLRGDDKNSVPGLFTFLRVFFLYLHEPFLRTGSKTLDESVDEYYW
jgi:hypothetical protein